MKYHFRCHECDYDDKEARRLLTEDECFCPLCWKDKARLVIAKRWPEGTEEPKTEFVIKGRTIKVKHH